MNVTKRVIVYFAFRYERELHASDWSSIRKGAILGLYTGWIFFATSIIYSVGFVFGSLIMHYEGRDILSLTDIVVVSDSCYKSVLK